jgi:hypothetical protein
MADEIGRQISSATKDKRRFKINTNSSYINNLIVSIFVNPSQDPSYNFSFKNIGGYDDSKHGAAVTAAATFIDLATKRGIMPKSVTVDELKLV